MIQVTVGNNLNRKNVIVDGTTSTPRQVLEANDIDYGTATIHMDGCTVKPGDLDKTFDALGVTEKTYLLAVVKTENA